MKWCNCIDCNYFLKINNNVDAMSVFVNTVLERTHHLF